MVGIDSVNFHDELLFSILEYEFIDLFVLVTIRLLKVSMNFLAIVSHWLLFEPIKKVL